MMELQAIWVLVAHYGYDAIMEVFVDFGDHMITHYVVVLVFKAGVLHVGLVAVRYVRKRTKKD